MIEKYEKYNLIFLGAPGAGKGTVANELATKNHFFQFSTGAMFREEIAAKTPLGLQVADITSKGLYVSDDITNALVEKKLRFLKEQNQHFILDGYPRTIEQVKFLENLDFTKIDYVVLLEIDNEIIIRRLSQRRVCPKCSQTYHLQHLPSKDNIHCDNDGEVLIQRKDDQSDVILKRLAVYEQQTKPLIDFYKNKGNLLVVNANQEIQSVYNEVIDALRNAK
ncbi:adenylate kinase family protein [[Mycoplasma] gypis]|uniref:Adenylate kinase n=1 Tax=[Mycoplasma] gypis TaxID=92404 RepID=A0ABZ2RM59_9BACT|nr:nucleoside monophosphate kinase [[Mycoplasma] gypis]MBN0919188.1 nucleoside monophosphate kinase [[Mycoplasma] gypis]